MRILILTQYFSPEPAVKFADLARGLHERGHEVQVVTGFPCYPYGRTYDGYRQSLYQEEQHDGVRVIRLPQFPDHSRSVIRRALYYFSFAFAAATIGLWRARPSDVILVYQSAFPVGLAARVISRVRRVPYVLDVVDLWPESVAASGMMKNRMALGIIRKLVRFVYQGARRINVITEGYWEALVAMGVPAEKLSLIHCWPAIEKSAPAANDAKLADEEQLAGRFNVMYAGTMGPVQDLRTVIDAALMLRDLPDVQFVMLGDGLQYDELVALAARTGASNVRFLGRKPSDVVQRLYPLAAALLVHLKRDPMSSVSIPSKTFAYMAGGRPILMGVEGESSRLIEKHRCGITFPSSDPGALANAVRQLVAMPTNQRENMGRAALSAYQQNYHPESQIRKFESLLREAAFGPPKPLLRAA